MGFTRYTFGDDYDCNWHHQVLADALDRVERGECKRLMVFMPPGAGKSELISRRFPAFCMGRDPSRRIVASTYGADLAEKMGRECQRIMSDTSYERVFPGTKLGDRRSGYKRTAREFEIVDERGIYYGVGVEGGVTGRRFDIGIIDDPVKDRKEADSETTRESVWDWYTSVFRTRRAGPESAIVLVMTRWHEFDLAGRLLQQAAEGGEQWEVIRLPAIREPDEENPYPVEVLDVDPRALGEPLWPAQADLQDLAMTERTNARDWIALYQQRPSAAEGNVFQRSWFRYYNVSGEHYRYWVHGAIYGRKLEDLIRFTVVDLAASEKQQADYTVITTVGLAPDRMLLVLNVVRARLSGPKIIPTIRAEVERFGSSTVWIESVAFQLALVQQAIAAGLPAREVTRSRADGDKLARAWSATAELAAGLVLFPSTASWLALWEDELLGFPGAHDDQVDTLSDAVVIARNLLVAFPTPPGDPIEEEDREDSPLASFPRDEGDGERFDYPWES